MTTLGITDLVEVCETMTARHRDLFEAVGARVAGEPDPPTQRWLSTAAHRHAWHAELWEQRRPAIPVEADGAGPPGATRPADDIAGWYRDQLAALAADTRALGASVDTDLDPATARVIGLVVADLDELASTAPAR